MDLPGFLRLQSTGGCADAAMAEEGLPPEAASLTAFREPVNQSTTFQALYYCFSFFYFFSFLRCDLQIVFQMVLFHLYDFVDKCVHLTEILGSLYHTINK